MTVKEWKEEFGFYDDDMEVVFNVCDDFEPDFVTEDKWGIRKVHLNAKVKPWFISECRGDMCIELERVRE